LGGGGGGFQEIQLRTEDRGQRERGSGGGSPLPPSQGFWRQLYFGTRNFISYSKIFLIFGTLKLFTMTTNLYVIANVKQLRTDGGFRILLPFFQTSWGVGVLKSAIFNSFHIRVESGTILEGLRNLGGGGVEPPPTPPFGTPLSHYTGEIIHCNTTLTLNSIVTLTRKVFHIYSLVFSLESRAWQEPEPSHMTGMALAHCILGKFLGVVCHCFTPPLDVPTLAARYLRPQRRERS